MVLLLPQGSIFCGFGGPSKEGPRDTHLNLPRANIKFLQDVDEKVLNLHPGVDAVGAIQDNDDVHVGLAPWEVGTRSWLQGTSVYKYVVLQGTMEGRCFMCVISWAGKPSLGWAFIWET